MDEEGFGSHFTFHLFLHVLHVMSQKPLREEVMHLSVVFRPYSNCTKRGADL